MFSYILLSKLNVFLILFFCSCTITPIVCWLWEINGFWIRRLRKGLGCPPLTGFLCTHPQTFLRSHCLLSFCISDFGHCLLSFCISDLPHPSILGWKITIVQQSSLKRSQHFVSKFATNPEACKILHNSEETSVILTQCQSLRPSEAEDNKTIYSVMYTSEI